MLSPSQERELRANRKNNKKRLCSHIRREKTTSKYSKYKVLDRYQQLWEVILNCDRKISALVVRREKFIEEKAAIIKIARKKKINLHDIKFAHDGLNPQNITTLIDRDLE